MRSVYGEGLSPLATRIERSQRSPSAYDGHARALSVGPGARRPCRLPGAIRAPDELTEWAARPCIAAPCMAGPRVNKRPGIVA
jgi:hypothetical protein